MNPEATNTFLQIAKSYAGKHAATLATSLCSLTLAAVIAFGNTQRHQGMNDNEQLDLKRRIELLESDRATRAEVHAVAEGTNDLRTRMERIENLLLRDIQIHHQR